MINSIGPSTDPWGTPHTSWMWEDFCMPRRTYCERLWRYEWNYANTGQFPWTFPLPFGVLASWSFQPTGLLFCNALCRVSFESHSEIIAFSLRKSRAGVKLQAGVFKHCTILYSKRDYGILVTFAFNAQCTNRFTYLFTYLTLTAFSCPYSNGWPHYEPFLICLLFTTGFEDAFSFSHGRCLSTLFLVVLSLQFLLKSLVLSFFQAIVTVTWTFACNIFTLAKYILDSRVYQNQFNSFSCSTWMIRVQYLQNLDVHNFEKHFLSCQYGTGMWFHSKFV